MITVIFEDTMETGIVLDKSIRVASKILGFANHSGVNKRIRKIGAAYLEYIQP